MSDREQSNTEKPAAAAATPAFSGAPGGEAPATPAAAAGSPPAAASGAPAAPGTAAPGGPSGDRPAYPRSSEERRPWRPRERSDDDGREGGGRFGGGRDRFKDGGRPRFGRFFRRKVCKFCSKKLSLHYRDADTLRRFITERGKILPRRITGTCPKHQRRLAVAIKQARSLAPLPYVEK